MNKQLIQNILYAGHCIGICSDWSEKIINEIIDMLKDKEFVYNESIIDEDKLEELANSETYNYISEKCKLNNNMFNELLDSREHGFYDGFKVGCRKAMEG